MCPNDNSTKKSSEKLFDKMTHESEKAELSEISKISKKVTQIKSHLKISNEIVSGIKEQFSHSYEEAKNSISLVGGSDDDLAKMWGYNFGALIYQYLEKRETLEGRQALSFIRMQLGHELNTRISGSEIQFAGFVLGLSLRFMRGFETLKKNLIELEEAIKKFEQHKYVHHDEVQESEIDLFGRKRENQE
ncbi:MAG: hypothetical protein ACXADY_08365 [Candidatus Hodarchaeales archaeon]|jgi:hypothetical protein